MSEKPGLFARLKEGLSRSTSRLTGGVDAIFTTRKLDDATLEELEELLITADLGPATAARITAGIARDRFDKEIAPGEIKSLLAAEIEKILAPCQRPLQIEGDAQPYTILVVGVNGGGKTTTIGKLAARLTDMGWRCMMGAADTFRAAAIEQLEVWTGRSGARIVKDKPGTDPAAVAYKALAEAREMGADVLFIDTAGRLQNKNELMAELAKITRVLKKLDASAPHVTILVLDATTGQNAIGQVEAFREIADVTGLVVTKLDGSARAGILVAIADRIKLPIYAVGVGEGIDDLQLFDARDFTRALVGLD